MYRLFSTAIAALACSVGAREIQPNHIDPSTYSNIHEVVTNHLGLDFEVDFDARQFKGLVYFLMESQVDNLEHVVLDAVGIDVKDVYLKEQGKKVAADWTFRSDLNHNIGDALIVTLPTSKYSNLISLLS